jgi:hypothetical protein
MKCQRLFALLLPFAVAGTLVLIDGCRRGNASFLSVLGTTVQGREIVARIEGPAGVYPSETSARLEFAGKRLVIEKERVLLNGTVVATVPADAKKVEVNYAGGQLTITADGKQVIKASL